MSLAFCAHELNLLRNSSHETRLQNFCAKINANPLALGDFLLNLAFLEHHGMLRLVDISRTRNFDERVLTHLFDEARHALYFLKKANQVAKKSYSMNEAQNIKSTIAFFNRLYVTAQQTLGIRVTPDMKWVQVAPVYFLVVYAVELRAIQFFGSLSVATKKYDWSVNFDVLLDDEEGHLAMIKKQIDELHLNSDQIDKYLQREDRFFGYYLSGLENSR